MNSGQTIAKADPRPISALARKAAVLPELAKWRLSALVVATAAAGFLVAAPGPPQPFRLLWLILGTFLCAGGANGLNQWIERDRDALMERTRERPLPSGRLRPGAAAGASLAAVAVGGAVLGIGANWLTAALGLANVLVYVLLYTPLKVVTPLNTLVGAVCGAIPPAMGWAAAVGRIEPGALALAAVLFIWQIPHSLSLAHLHRDDYARAGLRMLPVIDRGGALTFHLINIYSLALIPIPLSLTLLGFAGWRFVVGSTLLGGALAAVGLSLSRRRGGVQARRVFLASIAYLPLLLSILVADRRLLLT